MRSRAVSLLMLLCCAPGLASCSSQAARPEVRACGGPDSSYWGALRAHPGELASAKPVDGAATVSPIFYDDTLAVVVLCGSSSLRQINGLHVTQGRPLRYVEVSQGGSTSTSQALVLLLTPPSPGPLRIVRGGRVLASYPALAPPAPCVSDVGGARQRLVHGAWVATAAGPAPPRADPRAFVDLSIVRGRSHVYGMAYLDARRTIRVSAPMWRPGRYRFKVTLHSQRDGGGRAVTMRFSRRVGSAACQT